MLCVVVYIYGKYACVTPFKVAKVITITNASQTNLDESGCKTNKIWVGQGSEFYNDHSNQIINNDSRISLTHNK